MELDPITREEVYLSAIAGDTSTDDVPEPITRIEFYLKEILDNGSGGGGGGTSNYNSLTNKPQINSTTLSGNKSLSDLGIMPSSTKYAASIALSIDSSTFVVTAQLKDQNGDALGSAQTIDLPLETMVVSGSYDAETEKIILTLKNGQTVEFSVAALVSGLQSEITAQSKLDADLVDDSESTNKFVTASDKSAWTGKQDALTFNGTYNASTNPAATVSTVTNAIAGLDVSSAGGSGKYISAISETDGKISATAETMDTAPTASSTKAVTSGGVYTAIAAKQDSLSTAQTNAVNSGIVAADVIKIEMPASDITDSILDKDYNCRVVGYANTVGSKGGWCYVDTIIVNSTATRRIQRAYFSDGTIKSRFYGEGGVEEWGNWA